MFNFLKDFITYQRDRFLVEKAYWKVFHRRINWRYPTTFNEIINVYKISPEMERLWPYADKLRVRKYVAETVGTKILNQVYGVYRNPEAINFKTLPDKFVLKTTHGSNWNIVCNNKTELNWHLTKQQLKTWLATNYYPLFQERQYKFIKPQIMCEKYLEDKQGNLTDYKFFCFHGQPRFIQVDIDRFNNHKRGFYDLSWNKLPFTLRYPSIKKKVKKPAKLKEMIKIAEMLSKPFVHVRVDLYLLKFQVLFGELTFASESGLSDFKPDKYNYIIGQYF